MFLNLRACLLAALTLAALAACSRPTEKAATSMNPPIAQARPYQVPSPNGSREDEYYWLRDDKRQDPEMLAYLKAENAYADAACWRISKPLQDKVYNEIIGRLQQDDSSVPYPA